MVGSRVTETPGKRSQLMAKHTTRERNRKIAQKLIREAFEKFETMATYGQKDPSNLMHFIAGWFEVADEFRAAIGTCPQGSKIFTHEISLGQVFAERDDAAAAKSDTEGSR
jgi:hypothetical protein